MPHGNTLVDHENIDLVKHGGMSGIKGVSSINLTSADSADRGLHGFHRVYLDGRTMRAQKIHITQVKSVLCIPGRMIARHIQRFKIVIISFNLRQIEDSKPHCRENLLDFSLQALDGMLVAQGIGKTWTGHIDPSLTALSTGFLCVGETCFQIHLYKVTQLIHGLSKCRALFLRELP
ncbi:MAG: hypothetical protein H6Q04_1895 [Acidobacteria bacterium]|nr:hypothetical protein [Acidobacteriota bacterium]